MLHFQTIDVEKVDGSICVPHKIWVGNLPKDTFAMELREFFSKFGRVTSARVGLSKPPNDDKSWCFHVITRCFENSKTVLFPYTAPENRALVLEKFFLYCSNQIAFFLN